MAGFLFSFLGVLLVGLGARDQQLLAALAARMGQRPLLLVFAATCGVTTSALAALASIMLAGQMNSPTRLVLAGIALALASFELLLPRTARLPAEPTASIGAFVVVILAHQLTDAVRFLVFAIAVATRSPLPAASGAAVAAALLACAGWLAGAELLARDFIRARRLTGLVLMPVAGWLVLRGIGRI